MRFERPDPARHRLQTKVEVELLRQRSSGDVRYEERVKWWNDYKDRQLCVFGHYSNGREQACTSTQAICIDFAVGSRWEERKQKGFSGTFKGSLAALRLPERSVVTDDGAEKTLAMMLNT